MHVSSTTSDDSTQVIPQRDASASPDTASEALVEDPDTESLRIRKARLTRTALQRAAVELVDEHGLDCVTNAQIAERAGVSARTFFNYFPSKEDAIVGLSFDSTTPEARRKLILAGLPRATPAAEVAYALRSVFAAFGPDVDFAAKLRAVMGRYPQLVARRLEIIAEVEPQIVDVVSELLLTRGHPITDPAEVRMLVMISKTALHHAFATVQSNPQNFASAAATEQAFAQAVQLLDTVIERIS